VHQRSELAWVEPFASLMEHSHIIRNKPALVAPIRDCLAQQNILEMIRINHTPLISTTSGGRDHLAKHTRLTRARRTRQHNRLTISQNIRLFITKLRPHARMKLLPFKGQVTINEPRRIVDRGIRCVGTQRAT